MKPSSLTPLLLSSLLLGVSSFAGQIQPQPLEQRRTSPVADVRHPEDDPARVKSGAPRKGEPIDDQALYAYLEKEGNRLIQAGKLATNLLDQCSRKYCSLELARGDARLRTPADVARLAADSVMVVGQFYLCGRCSKIHCNGASGFVISSSGALATSLHVLNRSNFLGMVAMNRDGKIYPVREVLAADRLNDSVILQLDGRAFTPLPFSTATVSAGDPVTVLSHPTGHYYSLTTGIVSRHVVRQRSRGKASYVAITAPFGAGSSGAPVMDEHGAVLAMVNNTEPIYGEHDGEHKDFQMSVFNCTTAKALRDMATPPRPKP